MWPLGPAHLPPDRTGQERGLPATSVRANAYVEEALRWLPDDAGPASGHSGSEMPAARPATPGEGRPRILLADDNADMRAYVARILEQGGYAVEAVEDGEAALAAARREPPDLVLTDVMMPGLD